jgi:hypothetical protein
MHAILIAFRGATGGHGPDRPGAGPGMINDLGAAAALDRFGGDSGHIPFAIMNGALTEYARRGGQRGGHFGGGGGGDCPHPPQSRPRPSRLQSSRPRCLDCRVPITFCIT